MTGPAAAASTASRAWPGMRSQYAWLEPHEGSHTGPMQIGVSFSGHERLVLERGGRTVQTDLPAGSVVVTGGDPVTWVRVAEHTEALEIYPDPELLAHLGGSTGAPEPEPAVGARDGVVLGVASVLRRVHTAGAYLSDVAAGQLAHRLAAHLLTRYCHRPPPDGGAEPGRLDARVVDRVAELVDAGLGSRLTLDQLAAVAHLSPYHFSRAFKRTTGLAPYEFVTARRMDRARMLLRRTTDPVEQVARAVGFHNRSHFRRVFRRHTGVAPAALRSTAG